MKTEPHSPNFDEIREISTLEENINLQKLIMEHENTISDFRKLIDKQVEEIEAYIDENTKLKADNRGLNKKVKRIIEEKDVMIKAKDIEIRIYQQALQTTGKIFHWIYRIKNKVLATVNPPLE